MARLRSEDVIESNSLDNENENEKSSIPLLFQAECCWIDQNQSIAEAAGIGSSSSSSSRVYVSSALRCIDTVISTTIQPSHPAALRIQGAKLLLQVFEMLDQCSVDGIIRVKSFKTLRVAIGPDDTRIMNKMKPFDCIRKDLVTIEHLIRIAVNVLNDSNDDMRVLSIDIMNAAVLAGLVRDDQTYDDMLDLVLTGAIKLPSSLSNSPMSFTFLANTLIKEIPLAIQHPTPDFIDSLDRCLRNLASLDPELLESLIRQQLGMIMSINSSHEIAERLPDVESPVTCSEFISGIIDHCQLLLQFQ